SRSHSGTSRDVQPAQGRRHSSCSSRVVRPKPKPDTSIRVAISYDKIHGYAPGDTVSASISITVPDRPFSTITTIWTKIEGVARVDLQEKSPSSPYSSHHCYFSQSATVWTPVGRQCYVAVGTHTFTVKFRLPRSCDSSFESKLAHIRYSCTVGIERIGKTSNKTEAYFTVIRPVDLNALLSVMSPQSITETIYGSFFPFEKGEIRMKVNLFKTGFLPGEEIIMHAQIRNSSPRTITILRMKLYEISRYIAYLGNTPHEKEVCRELRSIERTISITSDSDCSLTRAITVPPMAPLHFLCPNISVTHRLKVKIMTSRVLGESVTVNLPIIIGDIALRKDTQVSSSGSSSRMLSDQSAPPSYEECVLGVRPKKNIEHDRLDLQISPWQWSFL
ncbi:hypothetical protein PFISCL1PPCAC_8953, partial [Pristionchus fissidentatus]